MTGIAGYNQQRMSTPRSRYQAESSKMYSPADITYSSSTASSYSANTSYRMNTSSQVQDMYTKSFVGNTAQSFTTDTAGYEPETAVGYDALPNSAAGLSIETTTPMHNQLTDITMYETNDTSAEPIISQTIEHNATDHSDSKTTVLKTDLQKGIKAELSDNTLSKNRLKAAIRDELSGEQTQMQEQLQQQPQEQAWLYN